MTSLLSPADERFVSLTTFRRSGVAVSTPVWIASDGDGLIVTTPVASGKVKRLRNNPRVQLQACSRMGKVAAGAEVFIGEAEILADDAMVERFGQVFLAKYHLEYSIFLWIERRAKSGQAKRVMLRITPA